MNILTRVLFSLLLAHIASAAAITPPPEFVLDFPSDETWVTGHRQDENNSFIQEYVKAGETVNAWTELATVLYIEKSLDADALAIANGIINGLKNGCPSLTYSIISSDEKEALFRWSDDGCGGWPAQESAHRVIKTEKGAVSFQYAYYKNKAKPNFQEWIDRLAAARWIAP